MALIGAIMGDIIGSQYEFPSMRPDDLDWKHCKLFTDECEFTDDTVMSIATKYAIDHYKFDFSKAYKEFGNKYPDVGYGDMFLKWITGDISSYQSYGNGSAMRVSYIGDIIKTNVNGIIQNGDSIIKLAELSASCTHNSYNGIMGAKAVTMIIGMSKLNFSKKEIIETLPSLSGFYYNSPDFHYNILKPLSEFRKMYCWNELCDGTVPAAIRCFLDSTDYESCIRNCLSLPCDMDTMCCIAGGMAEAFYGTTGFNNKAILQKYLDDFLYKCIEDIL